MKDRKERKRELDKTKKELEKMKECFEDLVHEKNSILSSKKDLEKEVDDLNKSVISMDSGEYVAGLKRQIKSLKQHNMALERKIEVETRDANEKIAIGDAKVRILEQELEKIRNPVQAAVRGILAGVGNRDPLSHELAAESKDGESPKPTGPAGGIWKLFSPRKSSPQKKIQNERVLTKLQENDEHLAGHDFVDDYSGDDALDADAPRDEGPSWLSSSGSHKDDHKLSEVQNAGPDGENSGIFNANSAPHSDEDAQVDSVDDSEKEWYDEPDAEANVFHDNQDAKVDTADESDKEGSDETETKDLDQEAFVGDKQSSPLENVEDVDKKDRSAAAIVLV